MSAIGDGRAVDHDAPQAPGNTHRSTGGHDVEGKSVRGAPAQPASRRHRKGVEQSAVRRGSAGMMLGAVGVVFGDIGTSPLYSLQTVFRLDHGRVGLSRGDVLGVLSLVFWSITIIVSVKYVALVMRADNDGEGGILALVARVLGQFRGSPRRIVVATLMAIVGAALFLGDSVITPAISVMSAVEGLQVEDHALSSWVLPISVTILALLFLGQRVGTAVVGRAFGPIMVVWFVIVGAMGVPSVATSPGVLAGLNPLEAVALWVDHPAVAFVAMGAVVLAITGAEALYADMGHFGASPIRRSWFLLVFPALVLDYFGQGADLLRHPGDVTNPFFLLAPAWATTPLVVLATSATVIASQAVISGSFSVAQQAMRLGLLPRLRVRHTSAREAGQIYVPAMNWLLFSGVLVLIGVFRSSQRLATAYGLAVTGTFVLTTLLFLLLAKEVWRWPWPACVAIGSIIGSLEMLYFAANLTKFTEGGWLPLLIAAAATAIMLVWRRGAAQLAAVRGNYERPVEELVDQLRNGYPRVPGTAVFPHADPDSAPLALLSTMRFTHVIHEQLLLVTVRDENIPRVRPEDRVTLDRGWRAEGVYHLTVRVGFNDRQDLPDALCGYSNSDMDIQGENALYYVSEFTAQPNPHAAWLQRLEQALFVWMDTNQARPPQLLRLPPGRAVIVGEQVTLP